MRRTAFSRVQVLAVVGALAAVAAAVGAVMAFSVSGGDEEHGGAARGQSPTPVATQATPATPVGPPTSPAGTPGLPASPAPTPTTPGPPPAGTMRVQAPIDDLRVVIGTSLPPRYTLAVVAGLPSGCAKRDSYEVKVMGTTIEVTVFNTVPTGNVACTQIYGTYELSIDLGSDFMAGTEYRAVVNGKSVTFRAQ